MYQALVPPLCEETRHTVVHVPLTLSVRVLPERIIGSLAIEGQVMNTFYNGSQFPWKFGQPAHK